MTLDEYFPPGGESSFRLVGRSLCNIFKNGNCWPEYPYVLALSRGQYGLVLPIRHGGSCTDIWRDAEFSLILCKKRWYSFPAPVACVGFGLVADATPHLLVKQLQGVPGGKEKLGTIKWERLLLTAVITLARSLKLEEVRIQKSKYNNWLKSMVAKNSGEAEMQFHRFHLRYDVLPKRMGFREESDPSTWTLRLR